MCFTTFVISPLPPLSLIPLSLSWSVVVNVSPSQFLYTSLVSIDVQEDQFISKVLQERLQLVPALHSPDNKTADGPSHIHFMPSLLIRQNPLPPEEGTCKIKPHPSAHNIQSTFDLFRRQKCCNAMPWQKYNLDWLGHNNNRIQSTNQNMERICFSLCPIKVCRKCIQCRSWCANGFPLRLIWNKG